MRGLGAASRVHNSHHVPITARRSRRERRHVIVRELVVPGKHATGWREVILKWKFGCCILIYDHHSVAYRSFRTVGWRVHHRPVDNHRCRAATVQVNGVCRPNTDKELRKFREGHAHTEALSAVHGHQEEMRVVPPDRGPRMARLRKGIRPVDPR